MIIPDLNLVIYAHHEESPHHEDAKEWWDNLLDSEEMVGIPWAVSMSFIRLMTGTDIINPPMSPSEAVDVVADWFQYPNVAPINPGDSHLSHLHTNLSASGIGRNLVPDAHIAAIAMEHGAEVHSNDSDFGRFPGLRWRNPLA